MDKYSETKLISKMDIYFETEGVFFIFPNSSIWKYY